MKKNPEASCHRSRLIAVLLTTIFVLSACGGGGSSSSTTSGSGSSSNATPTASNGAVSTTENTAVSGTLAATDTDGDVLTFSVASSPGHGTVNITNATTGAFTYTPSSNFSGSDSFTFKATDSASQVSNTATESVTVNTAPTASNGTVTTTFNSAVSGTLSATDTDHDSLSFTVVSNPSHGTVSITNATTGAFTYTPASSFVGSDSFTFKATDSASQVSNTASESVTVNATVAAAPSLTGVTAGSGSIALTFTPPTSDGGGAITGYKATCTASGNTDFSATGTASPVTVTLMNGGVTRSCTVVAINSAGTGAASNAMSATPTSLAPEDLTQLPEGDTLSTTSVPTTTGLLYVCSVGTGGGASARGPWFNGPTYTTWDETKKFAVQGSHTLSPYNFTYSTGSTLSASGNDYPIHPVGTYPIAVSDPMHAYDGNPNTIAATTFSYSLSGSPTVASTPTCTQGTIGFLVTGAKLFNAVDAGDRDAAAWEGQDACHGHPQSAGAYHYHNVPITNQASCLPSSAQDVAGQHSPVVGYAADGFPIYGNLGENGVPLSNADLDICHGHTHAITFNGKTVVMYHYHATHSFPYTVGCYRGTPQHIN